MTIIHSRTPMPSNEAQVNDALRAVELSPKSVEAYSKAGRLLDASGDPRKAIRFLRHAVLLAPQRSVQHDELAHTLRRAAVSVDAHRHRQEPPVPGKPARSADDEDPCWQKAKATCFELQHYNDQQLHIAEQDFLRRTEQDSNDKHGLVLLAQLYRNLSVDSALRALRIEPTRPTAYVTLARLLPMGGAVGLYRRAVSLVPSHAALHHEYGGVLAELRYYQRANTHYRRAISLAPQAIEMHEALAELRLLRHRPDEAYTVAANALALRPDAPPLDELASGSQWRRGAGSSAEPEGAFSKFAIAVALMAEARNEQSRHGEAASLAKSAVGIHATNARAYTQLGRALFEIHASGAADSAKDSADGGGRPKALLGGQWDWMGYVPKGEAEAEAKAARKQTRRRDRAISACETAVKLSPKDSETYLRLGRLLRVIPGRMQEAIQRYNGCLKVDGLNADARSEQQALVEKMHALEHRTPNGLDVAANLGAVIIFLIAGIHFFTR